MARKKKKENYIEERIENSVEQSIETPTFTEEHIEEPIEEHIEEIAAESVFVIAEGCAITTLRGILSSGDEVKKGDIPSMSFDKFIKIGHIVMKGD